jgi:hypothetical protein
VPKDCCEHQTEIELSKENASYPLRNMICLAAFPIDTPHRIAAHDIQHLVVKYAKQLMHQFIFK